MSGTPPGRTIDGEGWARAPGMVSLVNALRAVEALPTEAGAKAAAEPARREATASFIMVG